MRSRAIRSSLGPRGRTALGARLILPGELAKHGAVGGRRHVFSGPLGDDTTLSPSDPVPPPSAEDFAVLNKRTDEILKRLDEDAKARKYALMIGAASALFAAVKLGLIAFPILRSKRTA
jgi:hypothetical protein